MSNIKKDKIVSKLPSDGIRDEDLYTVLDSEIEYNTLVGHHINGFNSFMSTGINQIVTQLFTVEKTIQNERTKTVEDNEIGIISFEVKFNDIKSTTPNFRSHISGKQNLLYPNYARKNNLNYSAPLSVDVSIKAKAFPKDGGDPIIRTDEVKGFQIASIPVMVGSRSCNTSELSREAKKSFEEDPNDPGGYFILKGGEWVISMIETRLFNHPHVFRNVGHEKELTRLEFISKPGDAYENSSELIMRHVTNGNIYLTFTSNSYLKLLNIPFYVIFRLLGMSTDKEIIDNIIYGYSTPENKDVVSDHMLQILKKAFRSSDPDFGEAMNITDQGKLLDYFSKTTSILHQAKMAVPLGAGLDENLTKYLNANILKLLDKHMFPHIGLASDSRHKKLRYLGHLIHKLLLVEMQIVSSTDRDSLKNKRINDAGSAYAKVFKTQFNLAIVQTIKKKLTKDFKSTPFSQVPLAQSFKNAIHGPDLEKALIQSIVNGQKELTVKNRQVPNRLASEMLHRKNQLNFLSTLNVIRTPSTSSSKQDQRSDEMRRVHPSYTGFIDPIQSADTGEQVGMVKLKATGATIARASSSELLKETLLQDPEIIALERIFPEKIHEFGLTKVLVNGDWIGCCSNSPRVIQKYKEIRRGYKCLNNNVSSYNDKSYEYVGFNENIHSIDHMTTIYWDTDGNEINFWVDAGRLMRPILVVRNNGELDPIGRSIFGFSYDPIKNPKPDSSGKLVPGCFVQDIILTKEDIIKINKKGINIKTLHERGIIDYISPEEMENCYIAPSLDILKENQYNPLKQYTHCEIPAALFGLPTLTCPYAHHNQPPRITFQTNQVKQTCGWYSLNWPYRIDKHAFLQYYCEIPLIKTLANKYIYPNGRNTVVAIACYGGYNQEDSIIYNRSGAERGNYKGIAFNFIKTELEKDEKFASPDESNTIDIKKHSDYSKIHGGFVKKGTMLYKDDIVIGKLYELPKPSDHRIYKDASVAFPYNEPAMVENVIRARNQDDEEFCKVKFSSIRTLGIGDKFCKLTTAEALTDKGWVQFQNLTFEHKIACLVDNRKIEYHHPVGIYRFAHNGPMYQLKSQQVEMTCTLDHKLYVKKRNSDEYGLYPARDIQGKRVNFKKDAINDNPDIEKYICFSERENLPDLEFKMDDWLEFLAIFIGDGCLDKHNSICLAGTKQRKIDKINDVCRRMNLSVKQQYYNLPETVSSDYGYTVSSYVNCPQLYDDLKELNVGALNKFLPGIVWQISQRQARLLLDAMMLVDGTYKNTGTAYYYTSSSKLADDVSRLALHAGWSGNIKTLRQKGTIINTKDGKTIKLNADTLSVAIVKSKNNPQINHGHVKTQNGQSETIINYVGDVMCVEVPSHVLYVRENRMSPPCWDGNSSRAG